MSRRPHLFDSVAFYWGIFRTRTHPRWQGHIVRPLVGWFAHRRLLSFDAVLRLEWSLRRLLGQPLTRREWSRMTFTDKVNYRRLRDHDPIHQVFCDKLRMRDYVTERLGPGSVPRLLAVGEHAAEFREMKGPFVLKPSHGSAMVNVLTESRTLTSEERDQADAWLTRDFAWGGIEWAYLGARRALLVEELLLPAHGVAAFTEYRFMAFHGKTEMIYVDITEDGSRYRLLRYPDWSPMEGTLLHPNPPNRNQPPPPHLDLMLEWAEVLGRDIDFVRVDFYELEDRILVGELTPYPSNASVRFRPASLDVWLGSKWLSVPPKR